MPKEPKWTEEEAKILLNAYLAIEDGTMTHQEAISKVSQTLRQRAIINGEAIDGTFRNENGIKWQYQIMKAAYTDGTSGLNKRKPNKVFCKVVDEYKRNQK